MGDGGTNYGHGGGSAGGYHNIDTLPLGKLLQSKQLGRAKKKKSNIATLMERGFK